MVNKLEDTKNNKNPDVVATTRGFIFIPIKKLTIIIPDPKPINPVINPTKNPKNPNFRPFFVFIAISFESKL